MTITPKVSCAPSDSAMDFPMEVHLTNLQSLIPLAQECFPSPGDSNSDSVQR